jgi:hypothetical protein
LIGLCAGAGMNFLLLGFIALDHLRNPSSFGPEEWKFVNVNAGGLLVLGTCTVLWLVFWRKIRRLGPVQRWALAASAALLSVADLLVFAKYIN